MRKWLAVLIALSLSPILAHGVGEYYDFNIGTLVVKDSPWVDVRAYGALPSSSAAVNSTAFTNAISAVASTGGIVVIPPGKYDFNSQIAITSNYVRFLGLSNSLDGSADNTGVTLNWTGSDSVVPISVGVAPETNATFIYGVELAGFKLNTPATTTTGIQVWQSVQGHYHDLAIYGPSNTSGQGFYSRGSVGDLYERITVQGDKVGGVDRDNWLLYGFRHAAGTPNGSQSTACIFRNIRAYRNKFGFYTTTHTTIEDSILDGNQEHIYGVGAPQLNITRSWLEDAGYVDVDVRSNGSTQTRLRMIDNHIDAYARSAQPFFIYSVGLININLIGNYWISTHTDPDLVFSTQQDNTSLVSVGNLFYNDNTAIIATSSGTYPYVSVGDQYVSAKATDIVTRGAIDIKVGGSTSISTGTGSVKMTSTDNASNAAWIPLKYNGTTYYVPAWTAHNP